MVEWMDGMGTVEGIHEFSEISALQPGRQRPMMGMQDSVPRLTRAKARLRNGVRAETEFDCLGLTCTRLSGAKSNW